MDGVAIAIFLAYEQKLQIRQICAQFIIYQELKSSGAIALPEIQPIAILDFSPKCDRISSKAGAIALKL